MTITHSKVSALDDGTDATRVRPSDWNADHVVDLVAADVAYDNDASGLAATDVQAAVDELAAAPPGGGGVTRSTLGTTSVGASFTATRYMYLKKVTLASAGFLMAINAHAKGDGTNTAGFLAVVYTDVAGAPTNLVAIAASGATSGATGNRVARLNSTARWIALPVGAWLAAGDYWIGVWFDNGGTNGFQLAYSSGTGSDRSASAAASGIAGDSSINTISTGTNDYSIYADMLC